MRHPWLEIPIDDYEAHMALPSVGQAQLLRATLQRTVKEFQPRSLAILGVAGGNGLESLDRATVRRVVALDFNPDYLALCTRRYAASFARFEPVLHDLSEGPPLITPVECIFAGLVLELSLRRVILRLFSVPSYYRRRFRCAATVTIHATSGGQHITIY